MNRVLAITLGAALGLAGLVAADHALAPDAAPSSPPIWGDRFPDVLLQTHDGRTVRFGSDLIAGKTVAINFMYVGCLEF